MVRSSAMMRNARTSGTPAVSRVPRLRQKSASTAGFQRAKRRVGLLGLLRVGHVQAVIAQLGVESLLVGGLKQSADGLAFSLVAV